MNIDKKELFDYLDNYIFDSQSELKGEINQWICMKMRTKYYTEWKITKKLYNEYLDYKTKQNGNNTLLYTFSFNITV